MKFCKKCGEKLLSSSNFCIKCGAKLDLNNTNNDINKIESDTNFINNPINKKKNKFNKKPIIILGIISLILIGLFTQKDSILYKYYSYLGDKSAVINDKLDYYNKCLSLEYNNKVIDNIYNSIKDNDDFESKINNLNKLNNKDKLDLIYKICTYNANKYLDKSDYTKTVKYLNIASKNGYDTKNEFKRYKELISKIKEKNSDSLDENNELKNSYQHANFKYSDVESRVHSLNDYIEPNTDSSYLNETDLEKYDKKTLALIRNEIYARKGFIFQTEPFKSYFNSKYWYKPNSYFKGSDSELNNYELKNIQLIQTIENKN